MTTEPLEERYFKWLYSQVAVPGRSPSKSFWGLLLQLHRREFVWVVPNDDNRVEDGRYLRFEFLHQEKLDSEIGGPWMAMGCSVLEMLIALGRKIEFEDDHFSAAEWFWHLVDNLGILYTDTEHRRREGEIEQKLESFIFRQYGVDGKGGLFPLEDPPEDQRYVEIWYQMNAYLLEHE